MFGFAPVSGTAVADGAAAQAGPALKPAASIPVKAEWAPQEKVIGQAGG